MKISVLILLSLSSAICFANDTLIRFGEPIYLYPIDRRTFNDKDRQKLAASTEVKISFPSNIKPDYLKNMLDEWRQQTLPSRHTPIDGVTVRDGHTTFPVTYMGRRYLAQVPNKVIQDRKYHTPTSKGNTEAGLPDRTADGKLCIDCGQKGQPLNRAQTRNVDQIAALINPRDDHGRIPLASNYSESCQKFIKSDGSLGEFGKIIVAEMDRPEYGGFFYNHPQISRDCPNYHSFPKKLKQDFFIHFLTHLAWIESTCGEKLRGPATETGLYQHENDRGIAMRRAIAQPTVPEITDACYPPMMDHRNNIRCTLFNLAAQMRGRFTVKEWNGGQGARPQPILTSASTWGPIINASTRRKRDKPAEPRGAYATLKNQTHSFPGCRGGKK